MFNLIKPGYVLRFGTCPSSLKANLGSRNTTFQVSQQWPKSSTLGNVSLISHPSGPIADICSAVATGMRGPASNSRSASYSKVGNLARAVTGNANVPIGHVTGDFVGYIDGITNFIQSPNAAFSMDFSGCLMVVYTVNGVRHVAHAAASSVQNMDCKQVFLDEINNDPTKQLVGWFKPFTDAADGAGKFNRVQAVMKYIGKVDDLTTFGVVSGNQAYAIEAFKPKGIALQGNDWIITNITPKVMSISYQAN
jgi:hypothetical protein